MHIVSLSNDELLIELEKLMYEKKSIDEKIHNINIEMRFRKILCNVNNTLYQNMGRFLKDDKNINIELFEWVKKYHANEYREVIQELQFYVDMFDKVKNNIVKVFPFSDAIKLEQTANNFGFTARILHHLTPTLCFLCHSAQNNDKTYFSFVLSEWSGDYMDHGGCIDHRCDLYNDIENLDMKKAIISIKLIKIKEEIKRMENELPALKKTSNIKNLCFEIEKYKRIVSKCNGNTELKIREFCICNACVDKINVDDLKKYGCYDYDNFPNDVYTIKINENGG